MPLIPDEQLEQIREATDIAQLISEFITLKPAGRNFKACCPFHQEKTASFVVSPEKQIFHCFGCGVGGNAYHFLMKFDGIEFIEAVQTLAERSGIQIRTEKGGASTANQRKKKLLKRVNRLSAEFYFNQLHDEEIGKLARRYVSERDLSEKTVKHFLVGFAPESGRALLRHLESKKVPLDLAVEAGVLRKGRDGHTYDFFRQRLIFPIRNSQGDFIGFGGRIIGGGSAAHDDQPKYLNTAESPIYHKSHEVYGLHEARAALRHEGKAFIVEGYTDVLALAQAGLTHVVAPLGTALTAEQVKRLKRSVSELILVFDGDEAGLKAAWRALEVVTPLEVPTRIVALPTGEDPDSFVQKHGIAGLSGQALAAPALMDYFIDSIVGEKPADNLGRLAAVRRLLPPLRLVPGNVEKSLYIQRLADKVGLPAEAVHQEVTAGAKRIRNFSPEVADDGDAKRHTALGLTPFERDLLQALLSNDMKAAEIIAEIVPDDWRDSQMSRFWPTLKEGLTAGRPIAEILGDITEASLRQRMTGAIMASQGPVEGAVTDFVVLCLDRLRRQHMKALHADLSRQIREAEASADHERLEKLMNETNRLLKQVDHGVHR